MGEVTIKQKGSFIRTFYNNRAEYSDKANRKSGNIQRAIESVDKIQPNELKQAIDDLAEMLSNSKNERLERMMQNLDEIYQPRKDFKRLPVDQLNGPMLEALGEEDDNDPESVKLIRQKSIAIKNMILEKKKIRFDNLNN